MICSLLLTLAAPALPQISALETQFAEALESVHAQMERRRWAKARHELDDLLLAHRGRDYVLAQELRIREDMRRIVFQTKARTPEPEDLVSGELHKYSAKGDIDVTFRSRDWEEEMGDERGGYITWSTPFIGNYEIILAGPEYTTHDPLQVILDVGNDFYYIVSLGAASVQGEDGYYPPTLLQFGEGKRVELDQHDRPNLEPGAPYEVKIKVTSSKISVKTIGKSALSGKRKKGDHGWFSISPVHEDFGADMTVRIKGKIEPSWMQNKIDAALELQRDAFEESYDPADVLPEWFLEGEVIAVDEESTGDSLRDRAGRSGSRPEPTATRVASHEFAPGPEPRGAEGRAYDDALAEIFDLLDGPLAPQLDYIEKLNTGGDISELLLEHLSLVVKFRGGMYAEALPHAEAVVRADPDHYGSRVMLGQVLDALGESTRADGVWIAFAEDFRGDVDVMLEVAYRFLLEGRGAQGNTWLLEVAKDADMREVLRPVQALYVMAESGPSWGRTYEDQSRYYIVRSDLSEDICEQATRLLERAYTSYSLHLRKVQGLEKSKFRVFLFSGEEGYKRYAGEAFGGGEPESTAGVYSPLVKQLLIWNLPSRDDMFRTVLHEGFHQYLDQVMPNPPVWLNEGMAEYFELQQTVGGKWTEGQTHDHNISMLVRDGLAPMSQFIRLTHTTFRDPELTSRNYAQGWLYVHFLRNTTRENKKFFEQMFETLCERGGRPAVIEEVYAGVDLAALDRALAEHLLELRRN